MEREACRAAMLPMVMRFGLPFVRLCLLIWKLPEIPAGLQESSPLLARREPIGDVWDVRVDRADPVVHAFGPLPAIAPAAPRSGSRHWRRAQGHTPTGPSSSESGIKRAFVVR